MTLSIVSLPLCGEYQFSYSADNVDDFIKWCDAARITYWMKNSNTVIGRAKRSQCVAMSLTWKEYRR